MYCKKQFEEIPDPPVCDVCGMPLNTEQVRFTYNKRFYAITIKISDETALNSMRKGTFWFQSPKYYQEFVGNDAIGDINESAFEYILDLPVAQVEGYIGLRGGDKISVEGREFILQRILNGKLYVSSIYQNNYRLLCFYTLHLNDDLSFIKPDERMRQFGSHFSIVNNRNRFVEILGHTVENAKYDINFLHTSIAYISDKYRGVYTPGCKFKKYSYQNEYRFILCSPEYGKLPEKEKKIVYLPEVEKEEILSEPLPIDLLWDANSFKEIETAINAEKIVKKQ